MKETFNRADYTGASLGLSTAPFRRSPSQHPALVNVKWLLPTDEVRRRPGELAGRVDGFRRLSGVTDWSADRDTGPEQEQAG